MIVIKIDRGKEKFNSSYFGICNSVLHTKFFSMNMFNLLSRFEGVYVQFQYVVETSNSFVNDKISISDQPKIGTLSSRDGCNNPWQVPCSNTLLNRWNTLVER